MNRTQSSLTQILARNIIEFVNSKESKYKPEKTDTDDMNEDFDNLSLGNWFLNSKLVLQVILTQNHIFWDTCSPKLFQPLFSFDSSNDAFCILKWNLTQGFLLICSWDR